MNKKNLFLTGICVFMLGLAACNNNGDTAMEEHGTFNVNNDNANNYIRDMDLTRAPWHDENMNNNDDNGTLENEPDVDENDPNISNMKTTISSKNYPHTKAIVVQEARYKFVKMDPKQAKQLAEKARQMAQAPAKKQAPAPKPPQAPAQQDQSKQTAPAPKAPAQQDQGKQEAPAPNATPQNISQIAQKVIDLTNAQRTKNGLPALKADAQLSGVAQKKSQDMAQNNYFSHTSPTYGSPFDMMRDFGVTYRSAGENIAQGQTSPEQVVQSWMNSEGHRKNILSRDFTNIGVGYDTNGHHWTQMFIGK